MSSIPKDDDEEAAAEKPFPAAIELSLRSPEATRLLRRKTEAIGATSFKDTGTVDKLMKRLQHLSVLMAIALVLVVATLGVATASLWRVSEHVQHAVDTVMDSNEVRTGLVAGSHALLNMETASRTVIESSVTMHAAVADAALSVHEAATALNETTHLLHGLNSHGMTLSVGG